MQVEIIKTLLIAVIGWLIVNYCWYKGAGNDNGKI